MLVTELVTPSYADRPRKANRLSGNPPFLHVLFKDSHKCFGVLQGLFCLTDFFFFFHSCSFLNVFLFPLGESNVDATRNPTESFCALPCMLPIASPTIASPNKALGYCPDSGYVNLCFSHCFAEQVHPQMTLPWG